MITTDAKRQQKSIVVKYSQKVKDHTHTHTLSKPFLFYNITATAEDKYTIHNTYVCWSVEIVREYTKMAKTR